MLMVIINTILSQDSNLTEEIGIFFVERTNGNGKLGAAIRFRLRSSSDDRTSQHNILKHPLSQTIIFLIAEAGFIVKIVFLTCNCAYG
jgi:hypothetical protein